ncbi:MAG TPA: ATP-binding protein [Acidimicrobiales bacterium]|nr:ATP-binding protein [Acidimicrobiales bacterium]
MAATSGPAQVRPQRREDIGALVRLWEEAGLIPIGPDGLTVDEAVDATLAEAAVALVAERDGGLVGSGCGTVMGPLGLLLRVVIAPEAESDTVGELVGQLEKGVLERGARKALVWVAPDRRLTAVLAELGYTAQRGTEMLERVLSPTAAGLTALTALGGRMIDPALWESLTGMQEAKSLIERRVILPLAEPDLAERHGVARPKAIVLFGPPGTGKTTFAKGIASRLAWPFVEIEPSALADDGSDRTAARLAEAVERILGLASAVVFVDEVEDLASIRHEQRRVSPSVTNEFLRQIPRLRDGPYHLLVCATNWISRLDPAFLRPGRFDYVLPVGPPDNEARAAIWTRYVTGITDEPVDLDTLVERTELFTPADIEFTAHKTAQLAFEREHFDGVRHRATTEEFVVAISQTRPTLTREMIETFAGETKTFARS